MSLVPKHITQHTQFDLSYRDVQLFNEGGYIVIAAKFLDDPHVRLAQKCEDSPVKVGRPSGWHVVPEFLEMPLLHALLGQVSRDAGQMTEAQKTQYKSILKHIDFFEQQQREAAR